MRRIALGLVAAVAAACAANPPATVATGPRFPNYPTPDIPASVAASAELRQSHTDAWQRLEAGDVRGASRAFTVILQKRPDFYPSQTGLGFASLADRRAKDAAAQFTLALAQNNRYLPAWQGRMEATLAQNDDAGAIAAMEEILKIDPRQTAVRSRLELVRFRHVQALMDVGRRARVARRFDEARSSFGEALVLSPGSAAILRELALTDQASGALDDAEVHARQAATAEPADAEDQALLGEVLAAERKYRDASAAFTKAAAVDPRPEWKDRAKTLREQADLAALPREFGDLAHAVTVTRAQVAAYIGINLATVIEKAPKRTVQVATDVRGHWAASWILSVTQAGVLDIYANHTFQPSGVVRRVDLARAVAALVTLTGTAHPADLTRWRAAHPVFGDLPPTHLQYRTAALAVAAGAMAPDADGRFQPARPATGQELSGAVARIQQIAGR